MGKGQRISLSWKDKRLLNKKLKDDEIAAITKGRIPGPSNKTIPVVLREEFIRERIDMPIQELTDAVNKKFGTRFFTRQISTMRSQLRHTF